MLWRIILVLVLLTEVNLTTTVYKLACNLPQKITLGGWAGYTTASSLVGTPSSAEIFYWAGTLGLKDFLKEGNTLGFIFGQSPKVTGAYRGWAVSS